jgi:ABC-type transporter Mla subunit MlaD
MDYETMHKTIEDCHDDLNELYATFDQSAQDIREIISAGELPARADTLCADFEDARGAVYIALGRLEKITARLVNYRSEIEE